MILGKTAWHLPRLHMTPEDLRNALSKHGDLLFLGSHTHRHFSLAKLDEGTLKFEIVQCHRRIESEFSNVLPCFAAPFGQYEHFDQRAIDMFRTAADGFFFTTIPGPNAIGNDRKVMFRTSGEHFSIRSLSKGFEL
jgi:peptidoglycan/xylan/chitin deacetylase (PgdA/CDA1 family)